MRRILLALIILLALVAPTLVAPTIAGNNYYVDSSATVAITSASGTPVAGDWLRQGTTGAKAQFMSLAGSPGSQTLTISGITPGQVTDANPVNPDNSHDWVVISPSYTFTIAASTVGLQDIYTNNGQTFYVQTATSGGTTLYAMGTGAPEASGTLTKTKGSGPATIAFSANATSYGLTLTPSTTPSYVGSDAGGVTGLIGYPWKTLAHATATIPYAQDDILFLNCAQTYVEQLSLIGGGSAGHPFTVTSYGAGTPPRIYGSLPKWQVDWHADGANANCYYAYLSGYHIGHVLQVGEPGQVFYGLTDDTIPACSPWTLAGFHAASSSRFFYDSSTSRLYVYTTTDPTTDANIYWVSVNLFGGLTNASSYPNGANPAPGYINISNIDFWRCPYGLGLGDYVPTYCSSYCNVTGCNWFYGYYVALINEGQYCNGVGLGAYHCKGRSYGAFGFSGQSTNNPATTGCKYINCTYYWNNNVNAFNFGFGHCMYGGGTLTNCSILNGSVLGDCTFALYLDPAGTISGLSVDGLYVSGQTVNAVAGTSGVGLTIERAYIATAPSSTTSSSINVYLGTGSNIYRRNYIVGTNFGGIEALSLGTGGSFSAYSNIILGKSNQPAIICNPSAGTTITACNNVAVVSQSLLQWNRDVTVVAKNNIAYNCGNVLRVVGTLPTGVTSDFNYGWKLTNGWINYTTGGVTLWLDTATTGWYAVSGQDYHSFQVKSPSTSSPPGFVTVPPTVPSDFKLTWGAQANYFNWLCTIGGATGKPAAVSGIDRDYFGTAMPNGGGCQDVGAFQVPRGGGGN